MTTEMVEPIARAGGGELVGDLCAAVPVMVIAEMLGIDPSRREDFRRWSDDLVAVLGGRAGPEAVARSQKSIDDLSDYLQEIIEARQRQPRSDLISALIGCLHDPSATIRREALGALEQAFGWREGQAPDTGPWVKAFIEQARSQVQRAASGSRPAGG